MLTKTKANIPPPIAYNTENVSSVGNVLKDNDITVSSPPYEAATPARMFLLTGDLSPKSPAKILTQPL